jgi:hypothetical protein
MWRARVSARVCTPASNEAAACCVILWIGAAAAWRSHSETGNGKQQTPTDCGTPQHCNVSEQQCMASSKQASLVAVP